ncbi:hypothetical protein [Geovibrio sp. ADMFC3]
MTDKEQVNRLEKENRRLKDVIQDAICTLNKIPYSGGWGEERVSAALRGQKFEVMGILSAGLRDD